MSWSEECCESSIFEVKNVEEVRQVLERMGFYVETAGNKNLFYFRR